MDISTVMQLAPGDYFHDIVKKTQIYLHHTVGGSAKSTFDYWQAQANHVATAFIVERDGTIFQVYDPHLWAWHLGLKLPSNTQANKQSIGIEMASEGALRSGKELNTMSGITKFDEDWLYAFDVDVPPFAHAKKLYSFITLADDDVTGNKYWDCGVNFRGYGFFDAYNEPQVAAVIWLVNHLCEEFSIPKQLILGEDKLRFDESMILGFTGVLTHCVVRADKSDVHPGWDWDRLAKSFT